jgi:hypothetical protein
MGQYRGVGTVSNMLRSDPSLMAELLTGQPLPQ